MKKPFLLPALIVSFLFPPFSLAAADSNTNDSELVADNSERPPHVRRTNRSRQRVQTQRRARRARHVQTTRRVRVVHHRPRHRVVVVAAPPPPVVVVPAPGPTYVVEEELPHAGPIQAQPEDKSMRSSLVVRFSGISTGDTTITTDTFEGPDMGGVGIQLRVPFDPHWSVELASDVMWAEETKYDMVTIPLTVSILGHLFPDSMIDVYGVAGAGIHFTNVDYPEISFDEDYTQFEGHLGVGVEIDLGSLVLTSDIRFIALEARPEYDDPSACAPISVKPDEEPDSWTEGVQFTVGLGWQF